MASVDPKELAVVQTRKPPMTALDAVKDHAAVVRVLVSWDRVGVLMDDGPQAIVTVLLDGDTVAGASRFCLSAAQSVDALRAYNEGAPGAMELRCWQGHTMTGEQTRSLAELDTIWKESTSQRKEQTEEDWRTFFTEIETAARKKGHSTGISTGTRNQVLLDAHGRCMFEGCGADLTEDPVTRARGNFATLAHNVAASEGGPRGVLHLSGGRVGPLAGTRSGNMGGECTPIQVLHKGRYVAYRSTMASIGVSVAMKWGLDQRLGSGDCGRDTNSFRRSTMVPHIDWYRLRVARNAKGLTRQALSREASVSVRTISRWEDPNGCSHPPRRTTILRLAKALELFPEELTGEAILRDNSVSNLAAAWDVPIEALTGATPVPKSAASRVSKRLRVKPDALQVSSGGGERHACGLSLLARRRPHLWSNVAQSPLSEQWAPVCGDRPRSCGAEISRMEKLTIRRRRSGVDTAGPADGGLRVARGVVRKILGSRVPMAVVGAVPAVVLSAVVLVHQDRIAESFSSEEASNVESNLPLEKMGLHEFLATMISEYPNYKMRLADWPLPGKGDVSSQVSGRTQLIWHAKCWSVMSDYFEHRFGDKVVRDLCHALLRLEAPPHFAI